MPYQTGPEPGPAMTSGLNSNFFTEGKYSHLDIHSLLAVFSFAQSRQQTDRFSPSCEYCARRFRILSFSADATQLPSHATDSSCRRHHNSAH